MKCIAVIEKYDTMRPMSNINSISLLQTEKLKDKNECSFETRPTVLKIERWRAQYHHYGQYGDQNTLPDFCEVINNNYVSRNINCVHIPLLSRYLKYLDGKNCLCRNFMGVQVSL